jgi:fructose-bisphosphate aldolase class I
MTDLAFTARELFAEGKGILAADESNKSADEKRLALFGIPTGPEMRQKFRDLLLAAPGIDQYLSGVILFEETLQQNALNGTPFPQLLSEKNVIPGIKVDEGLEPMPDHEEEVITKGLIGLADRLAGYVKQGARFTKWRAELHIKGDHLPSSSAIVENAKRLASYACEAQRAGLVPMLEPEVLYDGEHSRTRCREVMETALSATVAELEAQCADPSGCIIKTSMALSGKATGKMDTPEEVAEDTVGALLAAVPKEIGGIVFLSGGQTPKQATDNLRAIVALAKEKNAPWPLTFSFARALQEEAIEAWKGKEENVAAARDIFLSRLSEVAAALKG